MKVANGKVDEFVRFDEQNEIDKNADSKDYIEQLSYIDH